MANLLELRAAMIHVFFFLLVLGFAIGVGVIFLFFTLNRQIGKPILKLYLGVLICLGLAIFTDLFTVYILLVLEGSAIVTTRLVRFSATIYHLALGGLVYFLPMFVGELLERPLSSQLRRFFLTLWLLYPVGGLAYFLILHETNATIGEIILLVIIGHTIYKLFPRSPADENSLFRKIANVIMIMLAIFLPLFVLEIAFESALTQLNALFFDTSSFLLMFYLVWNVVNAGYLYRQFSTAFETGAPGVSSARMAAFQLSKREQEIARHIAEGASNKQIGVTLSISAMTVKNHVYNIYKKTGASNRVELVNILTGSKQIR